MPKVRQIGDIVTYNNTNGQKYKWVKTKDGYKRYHRWLWVQSFGPIPKGYLVTFKDKNPLNCEIENLQLVSRNQHIANNRNVEKTWQTRKFGNMSMREILAQGYHLFTSPTSGELIWK